MEELKAYEKELIDKAEREGVTVGKNGYHWGSATHDNVMGKMVAFSSGSEYRPVDKITPDGQFKRHEYTLSEEQAKEAVELRAHAQTELKKYGREQYPNLYRGMKLTEANLAELKKTGVIDMTGCSSLTFSDKIADQYSLSPSTATPDAESKSIPCKVIIQRDDTFDDSIGAFHRDKNTKDMTKPPYEVMSGVKQLKVDRIEFEEGKNPETEIEKARKAGDVKRAKHIASSNDFVNSLSEVGIDFNKTDSLRGAVAMALNEARRHPDGFDGYVKKIQEDEASGKIHELSRYNKQAVRLIAKNKEKVKKAFDSLVEQNPDSKFPVVDAFKTWKETNIASRHVIHASVERGYPVGSIVEREDGRYQKQSDGSWKKLTEQEETKSHQETGTELKVTTPEQLQKIKEKTTKAGKSMYDGIEPDNVHEYTGETKKIVDAMLDTPIGESGYTYRSLAQKFKEKGHNMMVVGGAVRDIIQGKEGKDVDYIVDCSPAVIKKVLREMNPKWLDKENKPVYNKVIGLVSFKDGKEEVDITPVHPAKNDGKGNVKTDIQSRDFKMNSIHLDPINNTIVDGSGKGIKNTKDGMLDFCIDEPSDRNLLRAFKFLSRGNKLTPESEKILKNNLDKIENMTKGNKNTFLFRQIYSKDGVEGLKSFEKNFKKFFPERAFNDNFLEKYKELMEQG